VGKLTEDSELNKQGSMRIGHLGILFVHNEVRHQRFEFRTRQILRQHLISLNIESNYTTHLLIVLKIPDVDDISMDYFQTALHGRGS
jgi:hypothetical protein